LETMLTSETKSTGVAQDKAGKNGALWNQYVQNRDLETRNQLVLQYSYIAKTVALQMRGISSNYAQLEDIVNQGIITIIDCIEKYDPAKEVKFESYAFMRVRGAIIDFIRKQDWLPRRVRKTAKDISAAYEKLSGELMREPTTGELAARLNLSPDALHKHYSEMTRSVMLSFESLLDHTISNIFSAEKSCDMHDLPESGIFQEEMKTVLADAIDSLTDRERMVITLYYYENLKLSEISKVLEVSESRVCQIHSKAVMKLKTKIGTYMKG